MNSSKDGSSTPSRNETLMKKYEGVKSDQRFLNSEIRLMLILKSHNRIWIKRNLTRRVHLRRSRMIRKRRKKKQLKMQKKLMRKRLMMLIRKLKKTLPQLGQKKTKRSMRKKKPRRRVTLTPREKPKPSSCHQSLLAFYENTF
jgi:hypothetical protein